MTSTVPALGTRTAEGSALQAVLLDMDGTLVDTEGFWWDVEVEVFADLGHALDDSWRDVVVGGPMTRSAGFLIEATGADITLAELTVLINDRFEERIGRGVPLMPGAARLLAELAAHERPHRPGLRLAPAHHRPRARLARPRALRASPSPATRCRAPSRTPTRICSPPPGSAPTRRAARSIEDTATGVASAEAAGCRVVAVPSVAPIAPARGDRSWPRSKRSISAFSAR